MASSLLPVLTLALSLLSSLPVVRGEAFDDLWGKYMQETEAKKYESTVTRRERNLDHWDVPTAAAYLGLHPDTLQPLPRYASESSSTDAVANAAAVAPSAASASSAGLADEYVGHDAAVLFYAQWCRNCHRMAPSWDAVATHLGAGTRSSKLVMALFDCEKSVEAAQVCAAAGVQAYPTMMFVGSGEYRDTDPVTGTVLGKDRSAGPFGATTLRRTVKFQGNWQYADQILDWVNIMRGLSSWHSVTESGPLRGLRDGLFRFLTGGKYQGGRRGRGSKMGKEGSLPVGVPPNFQAELRGDTVGSVSQQEVTDLETKLTESATEKDLYVKALGHSGLLIDGLLFGNGGNDTEVAAPRDPFAILTNSDGWHKNATSLPAGAPGDEHPAVLRSCVLELSVDYCTRITERSTASYLEELGAIPESDPFPTLEEIEARLMGDIAQEEPYCGLIEACVTGDFEGEGCRVPKCPFENEAACRYVGNCLNSKIQDEYGVALGLISEGEHVMDKDWGGVGPAAGGSKDNAGVGGWGIPAS